MDQWVCMATKSSPFGPRWVIFVGRDRVPGPVYVRSTPDLVEIICTAAVIRHRDRASSKSGRVRYAPNAQVISEHQRLRDGPLRVDDAAGGMILDSSLKDV